VSGRWVTFEGGPLDRQTMLILHGNKVVLVDGTTYNIVQRAPDPLGGWYGELVKKEQAP